jgi:glucosamine--fructose-6-phosphate aminotransferase (isomerizing)
VIHLGAEKEKAIAATKTYSSELAALALLGVLWGGSKAQIKQLKTIPALMTEVIRGTEAAVDKAASKRKSLSSGVVVGRGYQLGNAHEMGLKLKECAGVPALSYSTADFLHGPVQLAQKNFPVFILSAPGKFEKEMADYTLDYLRRGAMVFRLGLVDSRFKALPKDANLDLSMAVNADVDEVLSPLLTILPAQWFAFYSAIHKGLDPAMPTGLKKVTKTK